MPHGSRCAIEWSGAAGLLRAAEPTLAEVADFAGDLAGFYNDEHNRAMLAHSGLMSPADVIEHYRRLWSEGGRPLLLFRDGALTGDADLRSITGDSAELAILVGARSSQGRGLGTTFGVLAHALAFRVLGLGRLYVSILPQNAASLRLFDKLGYDIDNSPTARAHLDEPSDITMSVSRACFEKTHAALLDEVRVSRLSA